MPYIYAVMPGKQVLKNVRALRLQKGFTQLRVALLIGRNQAAYHRFESGVKRTDLGTLEKVAEALEVDLCTLIHFHENGLEGAERPASDGDAELERLRERERHLTDLNDKLYEQLRDREEMIALLRERAEGRGR